MVQKIRKAMPKKKENKLDKAKKLKVSNFVKKKPKAHQKTKRANQFVFTGFYDRLKSIDVKHAHSSLNELNFKLDHLTTNEYGETMGDMDLQNSAFIQLLKSEKFNNRTPEYTKVFRDIEGLCFSLPLLILNKQKIVAKLLSYLDDTNLSVIHNTVIDLCIALIKDLRQDVYEEFMHDILPKVIEVIDGKNLQLMDRIFSLLSFSFKYLVKPIKENIESVYTVYFELLKHKNHFVRKFTAQSFSYIIRKLTFDEKLVNMLFGPLYEDASEDKVHGLSELLFEVLSGQGEELHSKAKQVLQQILQYRGIFREIEVGSRRVIRFLFLKLVNNIDVKKQIPIFEELANTLLSVLKEDNAQKKQTGLTLLFLVMNDTVKLKFGKRFCQESVILFTQTLNNLLTKNLRECQALTEYTRIKLAETLGMLYYFKHHNVVSIFQNSNLDFQTTKSAFTQGVYKLDLEKSGSVISAYFSLLLQNAEAIEAKSEDIDFSTVLQLKQRSTVVLFASDVHKIKAKLLVKSLTKQALKVLSSGYENQQKLYYLTLLVSVVEVTGKDYQFELSSQLKSNISKIIETYSFKSQSLEMYGIARFLNYCQDVDHLKRSLQDSLIKEETQMEANFNLKTIFDENLVLQQYADISKEKIEIAIQMTIDLKNHGFKEFIAKNTFFMASDSSKEQSIAEILRESNADSLISLKFILKQTIRKVQIMDAKNLYLKLVQNLSRNSRQLRLATLKVILKAFEISHFIQYDLEKHGDLLDLDSATKYYNGKCNIPEMLLKVEESQVSFETEKQKASALRNVQVLVKTGLVPEIYLQTIYHFLVGCLWIKFHPIQNPVFEVLQEIFGLKQEKFMEMHLEIFQQYGLICQISSESDQIMDMLIKTIGVSKMTQNGEKALEILLIKLYKEDTNVQFDFNSIKDFHFTLAKSMFPVIDLVLANQNHRNKLYQSFDSFFDNEYLYLHLGRQKAIVSSDIDLKGRMVNANLVDSEQFKTYRRICYSKLCATIELFSKSSSLNKLNSEQSKKFIGNLMQLLNTADTHLQKISLSCLLKASKKQDFDNATLKLPKYQKLLEGLTDDKMFKDMIPIITFGSQEGATETVQDLDQQEEEGKESKRNIKGSIPKLEKADRLEVLPFIIKLLFSKLLKKKGAINNKNIFTRRNIVYQFLSGLDPQTEFQLFFIELLGPLGISKIVCKKEYGTLSCQQEQELKKQLSQVSFSQLTSFLGSLEVIFKQLGNLLTQHNDYLIKLAKVLILVLSLAKEFIGHLKAEKEEKGDEETSQQLYMYVGKQSKTTFRKGLQIVKQLYSKFNSDSVFISNFSQIFYTELVADQLDGLSDRYISERSMLIELLTISWSLHPNCLQNYKKYPKVIPSLLKMLSAKKIDNQVFQLHFQLIKNFVVYSLQNGDEKERRQLSIIVKETFEDDDQEMTEYQPQICDQELAKELIVTNVSQISQHLFAFWTNHHDRLKQALLTSTKKQQRPIAHSQYQREQIVMQATVRDLIFVLSELSSYFGSSDKEIITNFLEMLVQLINNKQILQGANSSAQQGKQNRAEELLLFATQATTCLLKKSIEYGNQTDKLLLDKIFQMLLVIQSKQVRQKLCFGLHDSLTLVKQEYVSNQVLSLALDLNSIKKGLADIVLDFDKVFVAIQHISSQDFEYKELDVNLLTYCTLHLLRCDEFSVRDYTLHALQKLIPRLSVFTFKQCERQLLNYIKTVRDEMVLKSILQALKLAIQQAQKNPSELQETLSHNLIDLLSNDGSQEDFFSQIVSLQLPMRQKALRKLKVTKGIPVVAFRTAILPLVDYLIFDIKAHTHKQRNTVRYTKDQTAQLLEDALNVYTAYASRLKWSELFKLVRMLLYKIEKATRKSVELSAVKSDKEQEKIVTKCLCKVLEGFAQSEQILIPDAVDLIAKKAASDEKRPNEFSAFLQDIVNKAQINQEENEMQKDIEMKSSASEDSEEIIEDPDEFDIIKMSKIIPEDPSSIKEIQRKLSLKILPLLQRHLTEIKTKIGTDEPTPIRSYVAVCIAKIIRKLPISQFRNQLNKLVNLIVIKGLRAKDLQTREKARKALLKVIGEVSPQFLTMIIQEMKTLLDRGFQLHVFLYTVHYLLNHLTQSAKSGTITDHSVQYGLQTGQITSELIQITSELLIRELFGDLYEEKLLTDTKKKHIKESKARKAFPIFEVFSEYIDFNQSFLDLITPIIQIMEQNPNFTKIQQCEELLAKVSNSILKNRSLNGEQFLVFLYSIIERGVSMSQKTKINNEKSIRDYGERPDSEFIKKTDKQLKNDSHGIQMEWIKIGQQVSEKKTQEICGRVLASFGLKCLKKALQQKGLILIGDEHEQRAKSTILVKQDIINKLDPFVKLLLNSFKTFYNPIIVTTLNVMIHIIHLGLPSFKTYLKKFLTQILNLFGKASNTDTEFLNSLFKCVTELIRTYSVYNDLSDVQIKTLVLIIKSNISNFQSQANVFQCLKAIIYRKFICSDLYDLMENIQEMMVQNVSQNTREVCAGIFVQFILDYPLEHSRLEQHINHMLKNLGYFDPEGRLQLLETLLILVEKFPQKLLDQFTEIFFFTLFLRMVNDENLKCREKVIQILNKIAIKTGLSRQLIETVFKMQLKTDDESDQKTDFMLQGKLQMIQIFAQAGKLQKQDICRTIAFTKEIIQMHAKQSRKIYLQKQQQAEKESENQLAINPKSAEFLKAIDLAESSAEEEMEEIADSKWNQVYLALLCIENLFSSVDAGLMIQSIKEVEDLINDINFLSWRHENFWVRLTTQRIFGYIFSYLMVKKTNFETIFGFKSFQDIQKFIYQMLSVLKFHFVSDELSKQLVKNLVFLTNHAMQQNVEADEIGKIFSKASYIGRKTLGSAVESTSIKLRAIVQYYSAMISIMLQEEKKELLCTCVGPMLKLVYRTYTDEQVDVEVKDLSTQIVDTFSENLEKKFFIQQFKEVQEDIVRGRNERKLKEKLIVGTAEGQLIKAKKRIQKSLKKKEKHRQEIHLRKYMK